MKILRILYNQIGLIFVAVLVYLFYTGKIELSWLTAIIIIAIIAAIMALGKLIPSVK